MIIVGLTVVCALVIVTVGYVCYKRWVCSMSSSFCGWMCLNVRSMDSIGMEPLLDVSECNKAPALPDKRGSTLLRGTLHRQSLGVEAPLMAQAQQAPLPPPLRSNNSSLNNATIRINQPQTVNLIWSAWPFCEKKNYIASLQCVQFIYCSLP